nr:aminotransferase class V-fold PLP-dependent enzyme [uncultured Oscillibacter sp.]
MIYMDNAATTKMFPVAIQAMLLCMEDIWYNPSSLYTPAQKAAEALRNTRARIAACLNASPDEIIFTSGGSEADNQAILSAARAGAQAGKRHIREDTCLVTVMYANNEIGSIQPISEIGAVCP